MNDEKQPTCEERIYDELKRTIDNLRDALSYLHTCDGCGYEWHSGDEEGDECPQCKGDDIESETACDRYLEDVLEISPLHIVYRVGLSWGGPADGFYLYVDPVDHTIERAEYYFQDWFDSAKRELSGTVFDAVVEMFGSYVEDIE